MQHDHVKITKLKSILENISQVQITAWRIGNMYRSSAF